LAQPPAALGFINLIVNLGGFVGPYAIGFCAPG